MKCASHFSLFWYHQGNCLLLYKIDRKNAPRRGGFAIGEHPSMRNHLIKQPLVEIEGLYLNRIKELVKRLESDGSQKPDNKNEN